MSLILINLAALFFKRSELEFSRKCVRENKSVLDGGMFIFKKTFPQIACYVTVSKDSKADYTKFYDQISKSSITKKLFFVQFKGWSENDTEIDVKSGTTVTFDRNTLGTPKINSKRIQYSSLCRAPTDSD